jgi:hypothetical protein
MIADGTFAGAISTPQEVDSQPGTHSAIADTSGNSAERRFDVTLAFQWVTLFNGADKQVSQVLRYIFG